jgi:hypothetical protein
LNNKTKKTLKIVEFPSASKTHQFFKTKSILLKAAPNLQAPISEFSFPKNLSAWISLSLYLPKYYPLSKNRLAQKKYLPPNTQPEINLRENESPSLKLLLYNVTHLNCCFYLSSSPPIQIFSTQFKFNYLPHFLIIKLNQIIFM